MKKSNRQAKIRKFLKNRKTAEDALTDATRFNIRLVTALIQSGNSVYDITERERNV